MVEPKRAATCIMMRDRPAMEVLLGRRNDELRFMPGHYVFPGGRIDAGDSTDRVRNARDATHAEGVYAAVREAFEETGLMCIVGALPAADALHAERRKLIAGEVDFATILKNLSLEIDASQFEEAGVWVTPASSPIRFDTQYFLYHLEDGQEEKVFGGEITGLDWFTPHQARKLWHLGEIKLPAPVAYTLQRLALLPDPKGLELLRRSSHRDRGMPHGFEVRRGIFVVPLKTRTIPPATHTNCIIVGEDELIVIDPGADDSEEHAMLRGQLDQFVDLGATIKAILLTHSHRDHVGAVEFLRDHYGAPVWAHKDTDEQVAFSVDYHVDDGEVIESAGDPGWRLHAMHTPGHDPGHLSFHEKTTGTLLCGDMVANPGTIVVSQEYGGNMDDFMSSLERIRDLDSELLIPAHGMPLGEPVKLIQEHIDHRLWREEKIRKAVESGHITLAALLAAAYDDVPKESLPLAEHALKSHLVRLGVDLET